MLDQVLRDVGQPLNLFAGLVAGAGDKPLHVPTATIDPSERSRGRTVSLSTLVSVAKWPWNSTICWPAVTQSADERLEVLQDVDDVAAAVGQNPPHSGQLSQRLAQFVAVAVHRVRRAVDETGYRCYSRQRCVVLNRLPDA